MATVSGGLEIIESNGALVDPPNGFPYNKPFFVFSRIWYSILVMEALTSYIDYAAGLAEVRINGNVVGHIPPIPDHHGIMAQHTFWFANGFLIDSVLGGPYHPNYLNIVPPAANYIILGRTWLHYYQYIP
jgi:hypothetical protein